MTRSCAFSAAASGPTGSGDGAGGCTGDAAPLPTARRGLGDLQAGDEAFEIALLFGLEIAGMPCRPRA